MFPEDERFGLTSQSRRAAVSITSNIAEGFRRRHNKEYKQFLYISLGSCAELETQVSISCEVQYITPHQEKQALKHLDILGRMINSLVAKL